MACPEGMHLGSRNRIRAQWVPRTLHVVLVEPEIPPNTGNVARLCAATQCSLHLVGKLGFRTDEHSVRRAGLDYWHLVDVHEHGSLDDAERWIAEADGVPRRSWLFTGKANRSYLDSDFRAGDVLVFGRESTGLDETLLAQRANQCVGIPTIGRVRSLNLSNSVAIAVYEALRQIGALTLGDSAPADPDCHTL